MHSAILISLLPNEIVYGNLKRSLVPTIFLSLLSLVGPFAFQIFMPVQTYLCMLVHMGWMSTLRRVE